MAIAKRYKHCISCGAQFRNVPGMLCRMCKVNDSDN